MSLAKLATEARNPASERIDEMSALEIVRLMNSEDAGVAAAVARAEESIAKAIDVISAQMRRGGRLLYAGAGTSGRLGVLDASECPPTFNSDPGQVIGLIAGGKTALTQAVEGAEDVADSAVADLQAVNLSAHDVLVGIATSGRTPYVVRALEYARSLSAPAIGFSCNAGCRLSEIADLVITVLVGPEVVTGSTRLKAGTATKMVLNMLTTGTMVRLGKTYGNLMVDLRATNQKLTDRTRRIVQTLTDVDEQKALDLLDRCSGELKTAIVVGRNDVSVEAARDALKNSEGKLREALRLTESTEQAGGAVADDWVLGVDGGGSKTVAWLANRDGSVLGIGTAGSSNPQSVGWSNAFAEVGRAIGESFRAAGATIRTVRAACFGMSGMGRAEDQDRLLQWVRRRGIAKDALVTHDADLVLAAGSESSTGIALITGTGSLAFGRSPDGRTARVGGWGYLIGDEGSGYAIGKAALEAVAKTFDGRVSKGPLFDAVTSALSITTVDDLVHAVYHGDCDRRRIASLASKVFECADQDATAQTIVQTAASDLAKLVEALAGKLEWKQQRPLPLVLGGGILIHQESLRKAVLRGLADAGWKSIASTVVTDSAQGAVRIAARARAPV